MGECDVGFGPPNLHMTPGQVKPDNNNGPTRAQTTMEQSYLCMYAVCMCMCTQTEGLVRAWASTPPSLFNSAEHAQ